MEEDEAGLIDRVLGGDVEAYSHFVRAYQPRVFAMAFRLLRDRGEAENVAQDAFVKAFRSLRDFRGGSSFETWVVRIAINACRDRLKRKRVVLFRHQAPPAEEPEGDPSDLAPSPEPDPERRLLSREIRACLAKALARLSPRQRVVFLLKHVDGRSIPEIAEMMSLDAGTVKSHLFRAARKVRASLDPLRRPS